MPEPTGWRLWTPRLLVPLLVIGGVALIPLVVLGFLYAVDPMGDEWQCSDGEAPAGNACYRLDEPLPAGVHWDPLGNRPMPYNCDKDGWVPIARTAKDGDVVKDCVREGTDLPARWRRL